MRKTRSLTLLSAGVVVAAAVIGTALLTAGGASPTGRVFNLAPPARSSQATATSTALTTGSASPLPQGAPLTLTATITPAAATGMVQFKDGSTNIGDPVTVLNGSAAETTSTLTVGSHQLTAVFIPTNAMLYSPSTSPAVPFVISGATATSTTLNTSSAVTPAVVGTAVTLTATVNPAAAGGTVQFRDGATNIGNAVAVSNGTASQTTTTLTAGSHQLTAVFTPTTATLYSSSTSSAVTFVIAGATATTTTLATSPTSPVVENTPMTMTATITPTAAVGTVQFRDGNTNIDGPVTVGNGTAVRNATLGVGSHQLTAVFTPTNSAIYGASTSRSMSYRVNAKPVLGAALGVVPGGQDPPGDRGPRPRGRSGPVPGLGAGAAPVVAGSAILITRRRHKARIR